MRTVLLTIGMIVGAVVAASGVLETAPDGDAVAWIDGEPIPRAAHEEAVSAFLADRRDKKRTTEIERHVLDKLIDERILVRRAIDMGLADRDPRIRGELTAALIDLVAADVPVPTRADLQALYAEDEAFFARPPEIAVRVYRDGVADQTVPTAAMSLAKLRDYVGPTAARTTLEMTAGERRTFGALAVEVVERRKMGAPPLDEIEAQIAAEWRRRAAEQRLRDFLDDERRRARIVESL